MRKPTNIANTPNPSKSPEKVQISRLPCCHYKFRENSVCFSSNISVNGPRSLFRELSLTKRLPRTVDFHNSRVNGCACPINAAYHARAPIEKNRTNVGFAVPSLSFPLPPFFSCLLLFLPVSPPKCVLGEFLLPSGVHALDYARILTYARVCLY